MDLLCLMMTNALKHLYIYAETKCWTKTNYIINVQHLSTFIPILDSFSCKFSGLYFCFSRSHVHPYVRRQLRVIVASILWWDTARLGRVAPARSKLKLHEEWYKHKSQKLFQHTHTPTYYIILCHICIQQSLTKSKPLQYFNNYNNFDCFGSLSIYVS